jgi:hypothetical protein
VAAAGVPALVLVLLGATALPAAAATHLGGASQVGFRITSSAADPTIWNIDQEIQLPKIGKSTFWALSWTFAGSNDSGYMGIQTDARRPDGSKGQMALFSLWTADNSRGANGRCAAFEENGHGLSCRMNWTIRTGATYRLRVWRGEADATGQWWEGWIHSDYRNVDYHLGDLHVPAAGHIRINPTSVGNFIEYFGEAVACTKVPLAFGIFTQPALNHRGSRYDYYTRYAANSYQHGSCDRGYFVRLDNGVELVNGGSS